MKNSVMTLGAITALLLIASCMAPDREETPPDGNGGSDSAGGSNNAESGSGNPEGGSSLGGNGTGGAGGTCTPSGSNPCDTYPQCGCPDGQGCYFEGGAGVTKCAQSKGLVKGDRCTVQEDCAPGYACLDWCSKICATAADCGGDDPCVEITLPGSSVCAAQCDPMNPAQKCGAKATCIPVSDPGPGTGASFCYADLGEYSSICTDHLQCPPGNACGSGHCHEWCRPEENDCSEASCSQFEGGYLYVGPQAYGFCK